MTFNGAGSFIAEVTSYDTVAGTPVTQSASGTYTVNADGTIIFDMGGETTLGALSVDGQSFIAARVETQDIQDITFAVKSTSPVADDTDGDGTPNSSDECPYDPHKQVPGTAGCGEFDTTVQATATTIAVVPAPQVLLQFQEISSEGVVSAAPTATPSEPSNFSILGVPYDINFTGGFTSPVTVCINYDENEVHSENSVKLYHYSEASSSWEDITTSVDTVANKVCGETDSFSVFTIGELLAKLDVDGDDEFNPLGDGLLVLRYMFEFTADELDIGGNLINPAGTRNTSGDVITYLDSVRSMGFLDVDGDNEVNPLGDGLLILRYMFEFTADELDVGGNLINPAGTRNTPQLVIDYLDPLALPTL
jgi:hypothetical protein